MRVTLVLGALLAGCAPDDDTVKVPDGETDTDTYEALGPCPEGPQQEVAEGAAVDTGSTWDDGMDPPAAQVWVSCADETCANLVLNAVGDTGDSFEWYDLSGELEGAGQTLTVAANSEPRTLAYRPAGFADACEGMEVIARGGSYEWLGVAAPRVIVTPLWITSSTTRPSGCNFTAGIGGCLTDPLLAGFEAAATSDKLTGGAQTTLTAFDFNLTAGTLDTKGFAAWSAWTYTQIGAPQSRVGEAGALPTRLFPSGQVTSSVTVGGTSYTDFLLFGWSVKPGYQTDIVESKLDEGGGLLGQNGAHAECSATSKGSVSWN